MMNVVKNVVFSFHKFSWNVLCNEILLKNTIFPNHKLRRKELRALRVF